MPSRSTPMPPSRPRSRRCRACSATQVGRHPRRTCRTSSRPSPSGSASSPSRPSTRSRVASPETERQHVSPSPASARGSCARCAHGRAPRPPPAPRRERRWPRRCAHAPVAPCPGGRRSEGRRPEKGDGIVERMQALHEEAIVGRRVDGPVEGEVMPRPVMAGSAGSLASIAAISMRTTTSRALA